MKTFFVRSTLVILFTLLSQGVAQAQSEVKGAGKLSPSKAAKIYYEGNRDGLHDGAIKQRENGPNIPNGHSSAGALYHQTVSFISEFFGKSKDSEKRCSNADRKIIIDPSGEIPRSESSKNKKASSL